MATFAFSNAYAVITSVTPAGKEQNSQAINLSAQLGPATIDDSNGASLLFSGNDVCAIGINIGGTTYYGWISRPIKVGGQVKGFYFWTDQDFTSLALATADGNSDGDGNVADNLGFVLVVDQSYFNGLGLGQVTVGSSSDRVDNALNSLLSTNHAPVAVGDTGVAVEAGGTNNATVGSNATGNVLANDTDSDSGDSKAVTTVGTSSAGTSVSSSTTSANGTQVTGTYGTLTLGSDGSYKYVVNDSNSQVEALRTSANTLTDTFTYKVSDSHGATATTTLTVTIQGANDTPTAFNDYNTAKEITTTAGSGFTSAGATATGNVLSNDTDKDSGDGKSIAGLGGSIATSGTVTTNGTFKMYMPGGAASTFNPVGVGDEAWVVVGGTPYALYADAAGTTKINVTTAWDSANFTFGLNAQPLYYYDSTSSSIKSVSNLSGGSLNGTGVGFKNDATGTATSTTTSGMKQGTLDATNGVQAVITGSTVSVSAASIDGAPAVGMGVSGTGVPSGTTITSITYDASGNVTGITFDKALTSTSGTTLSFTGSAGSTYTGHYGSLVLNADGTYTYTPFTDIASLGSGQSGTDSFKYTMKDTAGATSSATLTVTVYGSGSSDPVATADTATASEDSGTVFSSTPSVTGNVLTNDTGTNRIVAGARSQSSASETSVLSTDTTVTGQYGTLLIKQDGTWKYFVDDSNATVNALGTGGTLKDIFTYRDTNSPTSSGSSATTLTITINGHNDNPVAVNDTATAVEKSGLANATAGYDPSGNVLANDTDAENAALAVASVRAGAAEGAGAAGTLGAALTGAYGSLTLNANGTWSYAVDQNNATVNGLAAGQSLTDSFNYTVSDGSGGTDTAVLTVTIQGAADTLTVNSVFVNEASPYAVFTVTGVQNTAVSLALSNSTGLAAADAKATLGTDLGNALEYYNGSAWVSYSGSATIPASGTLLVRVAINNDSTYEGNEAFSITATTVPSGGGTDVTSATGIGTIGDEGSGDTFTSTNITGIPSGTGTDDDRPTVSITSPSVTEASGYAEFTVSLDHASTKPISFTPALSSGTATVGTDTATTLEYQTQGSSSWTTVSGPITIAAGDTSIKLRVAVTDDHSVESSETFTLGTGYIDAAVQNATGVTGTATIADNDVAGFTVGAISGNTTEGGGTGTFTVKLTSQPTADVVITVGSSDSTEGTVTGGTTLTFTSANWDQAQTVTVKGVDDHIDDGDIGYQVTLTAASSDSHYDTMNTHVDVTNTDDDSPPVISIGNATANEGDGTVTFTVTRTGASDDAVTVDYTTVDGTATAGSDYTAKAGTLSFAAGEMSKTITVNIADDSSVEGSENFSVHLSNVQDAISSGESIGTADGTATITDNDSAGFTIGAISGNTTEAGGTGTFTVKLTSQPTADVVITVGSSDSTEGTVTGGATLTFTSANWDQVQTVTVTGADDHIDDGDIGYQVTLNAASADGKYDAMNTHVDVTNTDDDGPPVISIGNASANEGDGTVTFTVTRTGASDDAVSVDYTTVDGTATAGSDYTAKAGTLSFAAGEMSKTITVSINDDSVSESTENFSVHLSNVQDAISSGESIGAADGTATITDNDSAGFTIGAISGNTTEAGGTGTFTIKLTSQPTADVVITVGSSDSTEGTVTGGTTLTFTSANWDQVQTVTVTGADDHIDDGDVGYQVTLTAASGDAGYDTMNTHVDVTNTDDDTPPVISIGNATANEADGTVTFTVTRTGASDDAVSVDYTTVDGTAVAGSDYTATNGTLSFAAGEMSKTITVGITDDSIDEANETFSVHLSNVQDAISSGESIGTADGTATITDNDTAGFTIGAISGDTTEAGGTASFTVKLATQPTGDVVITVDTNDHGEGTVTGGTTLTFTSANWDQEQTVTLTGADDTINDGDVGYLATLNASSADGNYSGITTNVSVTNADDDGPPVISIGDASVNEGDGTVTFTVTRTGASGDPVTVDYATVDGTAHAGNDYTAATGALSFGAGETSKTITVSVTDDNLTESSENFTVHLSNVQDAISSGESIGTADGTATIADNDVPGITVSGSPNVSEGGTAVFTVELTNPSATDTEIALSLGDPGDAADASDYDSNFTAYYYAGAVKTPLTITGGKVMLPAGATSFFVGVATTQDSIYEGSENVTLNAAITGGMSALGGSAIVDDGSGTLFDDKGNDIGGGGDNDTPTLSVMGTQGVSEGSHAVFALTLTHGIAVDTQVNVTLGALGDTASAADYASSYTAYYYDSGGTKQPLLVSGGAITLTAGVTEFFVSVDTIDDSIFEGSESFTLKASTTLTGSASATASILDDGTGTFFDDKGVVTAGASPDDDHALITVTGTPATSEGSDAVFSVALTNPSAIPTEISLTLGSGADTASAGDYSGTLSVYYFDAFNVPQALAVTGGKISLPAGVTQFYVSVGTTQDNVFEGTETFTLSAAITGGDSDSGTAGIVDDGTGHVYDATGLPTVGTADDDHPTVSVSALPDVSEGSNAIYTVTLSNPSAGVTQLAATLHVPTDTTASTDYSSTFTAYYVSGGVEHAITVGGGNIQVPAGVTTFYVKVPTVQDNVFEGPETLTLDLAIAGGPNASAVATIVDNGTGHVYDDVGVPTLLPADNDTPAPPAPPPTDGGGGGVPTPTFDAHLDPSSDNGPSNTDKVTSIIQPDFTISAPGLLQEGQTVRLLTPDGQVAGSNIVGTLDASTGHIDVQVWQLDDGQYTFTAQILNAAGQVLAQGPVSVTIVTDLDGVMPSVELAANGGDFNHDGIADWQQNNVAQLPLTSVADFLAGKNAPASSFGAILVGDVHMAAPGAPVVLDATAQLENISIDVPPAPLPAGETQASAMFNFSVTAQQGDVLHDMDPSRPGLQTRVVIDLPGGVNATGYVKWDAPSAKWVPFMDDGNLDTYDNGATLLDLNHDGLIDRVVVTLTDGQFGDADGTANGTIVDPGMLVLAAPVAPPPPPPPPPAPAATPVYDVKLANGDHYYSIDAADAAHMAQGTGNVFQGVAFDSLAAGQGGRQLLDNYNPYTGDWYFATSGAAMPYACYQAMPGAGFQAAAAGQGPGSDFHLYLNAMGLTQLVTTAQAQSLNLASQGYSDRGAIFNTTAGQAYQFNVDGYLVANQGNQAVRELVHNLALQFGSTADAGFVEAVEQQFLEQVKITGLPHGGAATAADVNTAFGTGFVS